MLLYIAYMDPMGTDTDHIIFGSYGKYTYRTETETRLNDATIYYNLFVGVVALCSIAMVFRNLGEAL